MRHDRGADDPGRQQDPVRASERRHQTVNGNRMPVHRHEADLKEKAESDDHDQGRDDCLDGMKTLLIVGENDPAERARERGAGQQRSPEQ